MVSKQLFRHKAPPAPYNTDTLAALPVLALSVPDQRFVTAHPQPPACVIAPTVTATLLGVEGTARKDSVNKPRNNIPTRPKQAGPMSPKGGQRMKVCEAFDSVLDCCWCLLEYC